MDLKLLTELQSLLLSDAVTLKGGQVPIFTQILGAIQNEIAVAQGNARMTPAPAASAPATPPADPPPTKN